MTRDDISLLAAQAIEADFAAKHLGGATQRRAKVQRIILDAIGAASRPAQEWQDISTAPKDGVTVLGGWSASKTVSVVYQSDVEEHGFKWCLEDGAYVSTPTCWMPLPIVPDATLIADHRTTE